MSEQKRGRPKKEGGKSSDSKEKKSTVKYPLIEQDFIATLMGEEDTTINAFMKNARFGLRLAVIQPPSLDSAPMIISIDEDKVARFLPIQVAGSLLRQWSATFPVHYLGDYILSQDQAEKVMYAWSLAAARSKKFKIEEMPKMVGFKSDPEIVFNRLPNDPEKIETYEDLKKAAPVFTKLLDQMTNREAFLARIGSLFDIDADRKQAFWIDGIQDSGKSIIQEFIFLVMPGSVISLGNDDFKSPHWREIAVGKRVIVIEEAASKFIRSDMFKAATGDDWKLINPKNKAHFLAKLPVMFFMFSNEQPKIPNDDSLKIRIVNCRMQGLAEGDRRGRADVLADIKGEMYAILGYARHLYDKLPKGGRIPDDKATLEAAIAAYNGAYLDFIDANYVRGGDGDWVRHIDFQDAMVRWGIRDPQKQKECIAALQSHYGCGEARPRIETNDPSEPKRPRVWTRLKERNSRQLQEKGDTSDPTKGVVTDRHGRIRVIQ